MTDIKAADLPARGATLLRSASSPPPGVRLSRSRHHKIGSDMNNREILNVFEGLLRASGHPGIRHIQAYGPGVGGLEGVKVRFEWQGDKPGEAWAYLFVDDEIRKPVARPFDAKVPHADVPDSKTPGATVEKWLVLHYFLKLVHDLHGAAWPAPIVQLTPVEIPDVGWGSAVSGFAVTCADGTKKVLRATIGSGPTGDPKSDPWPGYTIPAEEVKAWEQQLKDIPREPVKL